MSFTPASAKPGTELFYHSVTFSEDYSLPPFNSYLHFEIRCEMEAL